MEDITEFRKNFLHDSDLFKQADPEDIELAFQLQNLPPGDTETFKRITYRYSPDLYRWLGVLLYYRFSRNPTHEEIIDVLKHLYIKAIKQADQFHGQASVMDWLLSISITVAKGENYILRSKLNNHLENVSDIRAPQSELPNPDIWRKFDTLAEKLRLTLLLRYLFEKPTSEIGTILNIQKKDVHNRLVKARRVLGLDTSKSHLGYRLQALIDGMLDDNHVEVSNLESHTTECVECRTVIEELINFERSIATQLKAGWNFILPEHFDLGSFYQSIIIEFPEAKTENTVRFPLRNSIWLLAMSVLFVGLAVIFIRLTPVEREFPTPSPTTKPALPPLIKLEPNIDVSFSKVDLFVPPRYVESDFSSDGNWGVIASIRMNQVTGVTLPRVELYNRTENSFQIIHESTGSLYSLISVWDLAPSISDDGQRVVYVGSLDDTNSNGSACLTNEQRPCLDIFLYEVETGTVQRLSQTVDSTPANGDSLSPRISGDGKWVAFWSMATNLLPESETTCQGITTTKPCMYVYLYDVDHESLDRIPIGTTIGETITSVDRISLSADGRYVGFTIAIEGQPIDPPHEQQMAFNILGTTVEREGISTWTDYKYTTEALVYDRFSGVLESVNLSPDGNISKGASASPVLSADGRYVAFVSASPDLIEGDANNSSDVFLRDRESGVTEIISVDSNGGQGNYNSGVNQLFKGSYSIDLSADGRYVIFESNSHNLDQGVYDGCRSNRGGECTLLYFHDTQTKQTNLIDWLPYNSILSYPHISSDGEWVSFIKSINNCGPRTDVCSNVMLYDRQNRWAKNLTNYGESLPVLPWYHFSSIRIPWQLWESKSLAISPDGKLLALGGMDSKVRIWNLAQDGFSISTDNPILELDSGSNEYFTAIQYNPNSQWIAAGTVSGSVFIWSIPEARMLYTIKQPSGLIKKIIFSQDNKHLTISTNGNTSYWFIGNKELVKINNFAYDSILEVSPDGRLIASRHEDGTIWIQSLLDGQVIGRLGTGPFVVNSMSVSGDGKLLAVCSAENIVSIWQVQWNAAEALSVSHLNTFQMDKCINGLVFSPDNRYLLLPGTTGDVLAWSVPGGQMYRVLKPPINGLVYSLAFSNQSDLVGAVVADEIILWQMRPSETSNFFVHAPEDTFVDSEPIPKATAIDIPELRKHYKNNKIDDLTFEQVVDLVKFPPLAPSQLPGFINFQGADVYEDNSILLRYSVAAQQGIESTLYFYEKLIGNSTPLTMTVGANADIIPTQLIVSSGRTLAEFVEGDWFEWRSFDPTEGNALIGAPHYMWQWEITSTAQRLRWQQYGILIGLYYQVTNIYQPAIKDPKTGNYELSTNYLLDKADLVQIASSMRWFYQVDRSTVPIGSPTP